MKKLSFKLGMLGLAGISLGGCMMNLPTPPAEITGSYTSSFAYQKFSCSHIAVEINGLARRENQLVTAQEQRLKTSKVQAFWMGYGQGDGIVAAELATVRGEKNALRSVFSQKCGRQHSKTGGKHE